MNVLFLLQLENNIQLLGHFLRCGHMCFVNNTVKPGEMAVSYNELLYLKKKHNVHLLNGNVDIKTKSLHLAERVLNLTSMTLGVKTGVPYIDFLRKAKALE